MKITGDNLWQFVNWFNEWYNELLFFMISSAVIMFVVSLRKKKIKDPTGPGFNNIRLKLLSTKSAMQSFVFEYLTRGLLIIGGAGSGKTKSLIEPLVKEVVRKGYSGIIYDFKFPGLVNTAYGEYVNSDQRTRMFVVNFRDITRSHRFNVFEDIKSSVEAREYASVLMTNLLPESNRNGDFFVRSAITLLTATIYYFSKHLKPICTLPHVITFLLHPETKSLVEILQRDQECRDLIASIQSGLASEKQTAGVMSTLQNALSICSSPEIFWVLIGNDFDLDLNDPSNSKLLVIGNDATLSAALSPVISLVVAACLRKMNTKGKSKSILLLDEAPTLIIPNFDMLPATGRENKIATVYCAQDISQIDDKYGEKKAEVLVSNLASQFYGRVTNPKTAEKVVRNFGKIELEFEGRSLNTSSKGFEYSSGSTRNLQQRDRLTLAQLRDLYPGEFVATTVASKDFKVRIRSRKLHGEPVPEITYANRELIAMNYKKVKSEIDSLVKNVGA